MDLEQLLWRKTVATAIVANLLIVSAIAAFIVHPAVFLIVALLSFLLAGTRLRRLIIETPEERLEKSEEKKNE